MIFSRKFEKFFLILENFLKQTFLLLNVLGFSKSFLENFREKRLENLKNCKKILFLLENFAKFQKFLEHFLNSIKAQDDQMWGTLGPCPSVEMPKVDMQYMRSEGYPNLASNDNECTFR